MGYSAFFAFYTNSPGTEASILQSKCNIRAIRHTFCGNIREFNNDFQSNFDDIFYRSQHHSNSVIFLSINLVNQLLKTFQSGPNKIRYLTPFYLAYSTLLQEFSFRIVLNILIPSFPPLPQRSRGVFSQITHEDLQGHSCHISSYD